jgi:hypothetical protein
MLKFIVDFDHLVDWRVRRETPAGEACQRETPQAHARRLPDHPRKANACCVNQPSFIKWDIYSNPYDNV